MQVVNPMLNIKSDCPIVKFFISKKELSTIIKNQEELHKKVIHHVQQQIEPIALLKRSLPDRQSLS